MKNRAQAPKVSPVVKFVLLSALVVGVAAAANAHIFYYTPPLTSELDGGDIRYYPTDSGDIFYQRAGSGPALLLVHGIGAGESSYEFRKVWRGLAATHTVYAIDLVGFGKSDKPRIDYEAETYIELIESFVRDVIKGADGHGAVSVIASSLSAAFVVAAADRAPSLFDKLVLVCPTGIEELVAPVTAFGSAARAALRLPILGTTIYNMIACRAFIRSYLKRMIYASPADAAEDVVAHYHRSAHQIGGERVLPSFLTGFLNTPIAGAVRRIENPMLIVWGAAARQSPVRCSDAFLQANGDARRVIIEKAGMLPQEEQPEKFLRSVEEFFKA